MSVLIKDGKVMAILRPENAHIAVRAAKKAKTREDLAAILSAQAHTFVGLAGTKGELLDPETERVIGRVKPGDSFVAYERLVTLLEKKAEALGDAVLTALKSVESHPATPVKFPDDYKAGD